MKKEIDADEQEAFIREVTEEVKNDNLKQMWEKYGIYIILLVVLAIVGAVSFEGFKSWRQTKSETWSPPCRPMSSRCPAGAYRP